MLKTKIKIFFSIIFVLFISVSITSKTIAVSDDDSDDNTKSFVGSKTPSYASIDSQNSEMETYEDLKEFKNLNRLGFEDLEKLEKLQSKCKLNIWQTIHYTTEATNIVLALAVCILGSIDLGDEDSNFYLEIAQVGCGAAIVLLGGANLFFEKKVRKQESHKKNLHNQKKTIIEDFIAFSENKKEKNLKRAKIRAVISKDISPNRDHTLHTVP